MASHSVDQFLLCDGPSEESHAPSAFCLTAFLSLKPMLDPRQRQNSLELELTLMFIVIIPWKHSKLSWLKLGRSCYLWKWEWTFNGLRPTLCLRTLFVVHLSKHGISLFHNVYQWRRLMPHKAYVWWCPGQDFFQLWNPGKYHPCHSALEILIWTQAPYLYDHPHCLLQSWDSEPKL